jgi:group I intron endonuclease
MSADTQIDSPVLKNVQSSSIGDTPRIGIYGFKCKITNKWYIGQSINIPSRWNKYKNLDCINQKKFHRTLLKYGHDNFDKIVLERCVADQSVLNERGDYWMDRYDSIRNGYNIRKGWQHGIFSSESRIKMSTSHKGKVLSQETRERMSISKKKRRLTPISPETITKLKLINLGRVRSQETRIKMSISKTGKKRGPHSEEHRRKISNSNIGKHSIKYSERNARTDKKSGRPKGSHVSSETRLKMLMAHLGKKRNLHSQKTKDKISLSLINRHTKE